MFRFKQLVEAELNELAVTAASEMGKNLAEARGDVLKAIEVVELACALPVTMQGDSLMSVSTGYDTVSYREPLGVFAGIMPFNFPAMIPWVGWSPWPSPPGTPSCSRRPAGHPRRSCA
jgi:malonate-semialdehyde dehydrogenase (acetylating)/methylmalonate-semialdehyde dehydrogenase